MKYIKIITGLFLFIGLNTGFGQTVAAVSIEEKVTEAKTIAKTFLETHNIPGMAIAVSRNGKLIWSEGFGYTNLETKSEVSPKTTQFRIASISKPITAGALGLLMDAGKMDLDASLYIYVPDFPKKAHDFTVRQVAGHLAGIRHYNGTEFLMNKKMSIVEGLDIFKNDPLKFEPGTKFSYSTYGWNLISVVVQNASGIEFNTYITHKLFDPLGMNHTTLDRSDDAMPNRTSFYVKSNAGMVVLGPSVSNEFKVAGGGFLSTAEDLILFGNEIISPRILSKETVTQLVTPLNFKSGKQSDYGVGFGIGTTQNDTPKYSHSGGGIGASTLLLMYPDEQIVISILTNLSRVRIRDLGKSLEDVFVNHTD